MTQRVRSVLVLGFLTATGRAQHPCRFCPPEPEWTEPESTRRLQDLPAGGLTVDLGSHRQTLQAWGTSLCWWANGVGGWRDRTKLGKLLDLIFANFSAESLYHSIRNGDPLPNSLGLTQARYNIGGGEAPEHVQFMRAGGAVQGYQAANGSWNWGADATQRAVLAGALKRGLSVVQAFSNSPPAWMTISGSTTGAKGGVSNLQSTHYDVFAEYLAFVVRRFATDPAMLGGRTLVFDSVTPFNEPNAYWWKFGNSQEGCHFSPEQQSTVLAKLLFQLRANGVTRTGISAAEENWVDGTKRSVASYSEEVVDKLQLVTTHSYGASKWARAALAQWAAAHGKPLWISEFGTGVGPLQGGIHLAQRIIADLTKLNCTVWTIWQVVNLDNSLGWSGWGGITATFPPATGRFRLKKQYYSFKQFTAFIRPGSTLLSVKSNLSHVSAIAAVLPLDTSGHDHGPVLVLVAVNAGDWKVPTPVRFSGASDPAIVKDVNAYLTDPHHHCTPVEAPAFENDRIDLLLPRRSIMTLVIDLAHMMVPRSLFI